MPIYRRSKEIAGTGVRMGKNNRPERVDEQKYLTMEQLRDLLEAIENDKANFLRERDYAAVLCGFYLALRIGETATLNRSNFRHLDKGIVYVTRLKKRTDQAEHRLPFVENGVVEFIKKYMKVEMRKDQEWLFEPYRQPGTHVSTWTLQTMFGTYARVAGIDKATSWHSLRHGRGLQLWTKFKDLKVVQEFLGHSSVITAGIYIHLDPKMRETRTKELEADWRDL